MSKRYTPKALHISRDGMTHLCGPKPEGSWHDRCLTNRFIETLPLCEACETISEESKTRTALAVTSPPPSLLESQSGITDLKNERIYVCDYRRK